jgi:hypothetical protein
MLAIESEITIIIIVRAIIEMMNVQRDREKEMMCDKRAYE